MLPTVLLALIKLALWKMTLPFMREIPLPYLDRALLQVQVLIVIVAL